jgi:GT2 family glycosyltransferase
VTDVDLVVATAGRERELRAFVESALAQEAAQARVIVVDQNDDDRVERALRGLPEVVHLRAPRGVSNARTLGLAAATAPLVAWPDDDCVYPPGLLAAVVERFAAEPPLDVLVGRIEDPSGGSSIFERGDDSLVLDRRSLWPYASAPAFFARLDAARRVGDWSTAFGPDSERWDAGEDSDWLIRAVAAGLRVRYDPTVHVLHADVFARGSREARSRARRYGRSTSALALSHGYGLRFVATLVVRAAAGAALSLAHGNVERAGIYAQSLAGRVEGAVAYLRRA